MDNQDMDDLDGERFVDNKTGNSVLFTFEDAETLVIDLDSPKKDEDGVFIPIKSFRLNIITGKID